MNAKTAKALRKFIRQNTPTDAVNSYVAGPSRTRLVPDLTAPLNLDGTPKMRPFTITGTIRLAAGSPRLAVKRLKGISGSLIRSLVAGPQAA